MPAPFWPWEINARLHGPQTPRDKVVLAITAALGIVVSLTIVAGALMVTP